ncbi:RHS repeat domain-containing protein [Pelomonas sp. BJYL3]|uniref:RHS repeat domain-containing protein n=1 Tax=Pelomonas sp. BJYL3 TaxID=2976697 RepID=UPI0022B561B6|nr:RHS repeat-associated core domain-containing protein [Pelomonas sp. BJYL3]
MPNALGEPSQVGSFATGLSFHPNGAVNSFRFGNGIQHTQGLNLRGLPESKQDAGVLNDVYVYDANGNVNSISDRQENVFSRSMVYDDLDRLKTVSAPGVWGTAAYTYDAADNLKTANVGSRNVTLNYLDGTNRLNRVDVNGTQQLYDYDPYGNIKRKGAQQYFFDQGNRLQSAVPGGSYVYDGLGRRIQVSGGGDGSTRLSLYSQAGQLLWSTSSGGSRPASTTAYVYLAGKAIAEVNSASGTQYVHTDALGSPVAHTGPTGTLLNRTRYEPYGYVAAGTKPGPATSLMGYTGHVQDAETELVYMQQRYYDPIVGRFLSVDPIVTDANTGKGFGLYTYVENNPYAKVDPDGRESVGEMIDRNATESAAAGNGGATFGWAFAGVAWKYLGAEGVSQIADKGSSAGRGDAVSAGVELAGVLPFGKILSPVARELSAAARAVDWTAHGGKHVAGSRMPWSKVVESTISGPAKYLHGTNVESLERYVWEHGTQATNGRTWKVMAFGEEIGASNGKPSRWIRVEESGGTIHGHPISEAEFKKLTKE